MNFRVPVRLAFLLVAVSVGMPARAATSALWGVEGERWDARGRLPDFSFAGYHCGEAIPPTLRRGVSVKRFGAKGDGVTDDTVAFLEAIATVKVGAIEVPPGRYLITSILEIRRSGLVLRGAGPDKTILFFPKPLQEIKPDWSATTTGRRTSNYSWAGGFVWLKGDFRSVLLATVVTASQRGDTTLRVSDTRGLHVGQRIEILETDNGDNSLANHLYSGDPGNTTNLFGSTRASLVCRLEKIAGDQVWFDRPLRFDVRLQWHPCVRSFEPAVAESGVESLCFEFPNTAYQGHFTESGFNALAFSGVADCWARHLRITNADSGIFCGGRFCTIQDVRFESARPPARDGNTGHHGFGFEGEDNFFADFDFRTRFIHDLTVDHCAAGNVFARGKGVDLCFDHHRRACYENLFVNLDAGAGTRLWLSSGGANLGKHCAARGTFWNIRTAAPQRYPPEDFGPSSMNFIAVDTDQPSELNPTGRWFEAMPSARIIPPDIHAAQLARRLKAK